MYLAVKNLANICVFIGLMFFKIMFMKDDGIFQVLLTKYVLNSVNSDRHTFGYCNFSLVQPIPDQQLFLLEDDININYISSIHTIKQILNIFTYLDETLK